MAGLSEFFDAEATTKKLGRSIFGDSGGVKRFGVNNDPEWEQKKCLNDYMIYAAIHYHTHSDKEVLRFNGGETLKDIKRKVLVEGN